MPLARRRLSQLLLAALVAPACGGPNDGVADPASARLAYLGLDRAIDRAIELGLAGFNAAGSANIPEQTGDGERSGRMIVGGKVDQGASANKGMRLEMTLEQDYADVVLEGEREVVYNGGPAALDMSFKGLPDADLTGSLRGDFVMTGDLVGGVTLDVTFTGATMDADGTIVRVPGSIQVTGTATSDYGVFEIDVAL
jgi:hypothetical protein